MINLIIGKKYFYYFIWVIKEVKQDLYIWEMFFYFLEEVWIILGQLFFYIDVVKLKGYSIVFARYWVYGEWLKNWKNERDIFFFEFFSIVVGLSLW